jgi:hypothetical protein
MITLLAVLAVICIALGGGGLLVLYALDQRTAAEESGYEFGKREG